MSKVKSSAIDLDYRPESYFWAYDNNIKLASDIKGAERKELYERALEVGDIDLANSLISVPTCRRRSNFDHLCRLNFDQGSWAVL